MWPRADSVPVGGRRLLGGFVAFLRRPDAEKAAKELDGAEWGGNTLRTGWGKAVPLPARPIYGEPTRFLSRSPSSHTTLLPCAHRQRSRALPIVPIATESVALIEATMTTPARPHGEVLGQGLALSRRREGHGRLLRKAWTKNSCGASVRGSGSMARDSRR